MPRYAYKCRHCKETEERDLSVKEHSKGQYCDNCGGGLTINFRVQRPTICIPPGWNDQTQFDVMDPRAFAGKGSKERRDFVNETYGQKDLITGQSTLLNDANLAPLDVGE